MSQFIILSSLIGVVGFLLFYLIVRLIYKKLKGKEINLKTNLLYMGFCVLALGGLILMNIFFIASKVIEKKDEIVDMGQDALSSTVAFGATTFFEGMGKTMDHFEEKWEIEGVKLSKDIEVTIGDSYREKNNEQSDSLFITLIFDYQKKDSIKIVMSDIYDYLLIGDQDSVFYSLKHESFNSRVLHEGKTSRTFHCIIPHTFDLHYIRFYDTYKNVKE